MKHPPLQHLLLAAVLLGFALPLNVSGQTLTATSGTIAWNTAGNWTPSGVPNAIGASAAFNSPTAALTVNLGAAITVGSLSFTNNSTFLNTIANGTGGSLTFDAVGSGEASITVGGSSVTTNTVTISASTTLTDTLRFTNNLTGGTGAATATMTGAMTGAGGFIKDGPGRFSFSTVDKTYTGPTTVNQGRLRMTGSGEITGTSSIMVNNGGSLYLDQAAQTWTLGTGSITLNGDGDNGGGTGTQGALRNQNSGVNIVSNAIVLGSAATIHSENSAGTLRLTGPISGNFTLTKSGAGTLNLTNANPGYTGGTSVTNGSITVDSTSALGSGSLAFAQTTGVNTSITLSNSTQAVGNLSTAWVDTTGTFAQTLTLTGAALTINQSTDATFGNGAVSTLTGVIAGTGSLIKAGVAALSLTGINTYTGGTTVSAGTLTLGHATNTLANSGSVLVNGGILNVANPDTVGAVTLSSGSISGAGTLTASSYALTNTGSISATLAGAAALTKSGTGTATLSGPNTYSGGTTVSAGTLLVNNTSGSGTGSSTVLVETNGTLGGSGIISGNTTIQGIHSPGNSPGLQSFGSGLTYSGGASVVNWELAGNTVSGRGTNFDGIDVTGTLDFAGATTLNLSFDNLGSTVDWTNTLWLTDQTWLLYQVTTATNNIGNFNIFTSNWKDSTGAFFNTVLIGSTFTLSQTGNDVFLNFTAIPEPSRAILLGLGAIALIFRRRRQ